MRKNIYSLICLLFLCIHLLHSQEPAAEVLNCQTKITFERGILKKAVSWDIKINNRDGDSYTTVEIPFSKLNKVTNIKAYIKDFNGNIIKKLSSSNITEHSALGSYSFYEDNMVRKFTLKHNTHPYVLSYCYQEQTCEFLEIASWCPVIDQKIPTNNAEISIEAPTNYPIYFRNFLTSNVKIDSIKEKIRHSWQTKYTPNHKYEIYMPSKENYYPIVEIVPGYFHYDINGSFKDWTSFGDWQYNLNKNLGELPIEEKERIDSITIRFQDKKEKIKALYHYLQDETRYVYIGIKTGGMKPYPASFVSANKYGDCKALTNYMKSMLNHIGIPSYYTAVYAGDIIKSIVKEFPSQQFNHVILTIPLDKDTVWLDCTSDGPFNYLGTFTQNRDAFMIEKNNSHFTKTPALNLKEVTDTRLVTFIEKTRNETFAQFKNTYRSNDFMNLLSISKNLDESTINQLIQYHFIENGFNPQDFNLCAPSSRDSAFIQLNYSATTNKIINQYGNDKIIRLLPFPISDFSNPENRKYPIQLDFPICKSDTLDYILPEKFSIDNSIHDQSITSDFGEYSIHFLTTNSKLRVIKKFFLKAGSYPLKHYAEFYNFIQKVKNLEKNTLIMINKPA